MIQKKQLTTKVDEIRNDRNKSDEEKTDALIELFKEYIQSERELELKSLNFPENKAYLITGMHRSGTSFVAKALHDAGVYFGDPGAILGSNEHNPLGHYENAHWNHMSDRLIQAAGGTWMSLPNDENLSVQSEQQQWKEGMKERVEMHERKYWAWKDPRLCGTLPYVLPYINGDVYVVAVFRKKEKVVESLCRRQRGMISNQARNIYEQYNRRLLENLRKFAEV